VHLDTHAVVWLYQSGAERFPPAARVRLEEEELRVSPIVALELTFLHEIGRVAPTAREVLSELERTVGLRPSTSGFAAVVGIAQTLPWTRDPFNRLICADARVSAMTLLTKDRAIREHIDWAHWD
jgi:PIN domain nuclease of toxin-antitoxin system